MTWEARIIAALAGAAGGIGLAAALLYRSRPVKPYDAAAVRTAWLKRERSGR
jgi:ribosome modulation factor